MMLTAFLKSFMTPFAIVVGFCVDPLRSTVYNSFSEILQKINFFLYHFLQWYLQTKQKTHPIRSCNQTHASWVLVTDLLSNYDTTLWNLVMNGSDVLQRLQHFGHFLSSHHHKETKLSNIHRTLFQFRVEFCFRRRVSEGWGVVIGVQSVDSRGRDEPIHVHLFWSLPRSENFGKVGWPSNIGCRAAENLEMAMTSEITYHS